MLLFIASKSFYVYNVFAFFSSVYNHMIIYINKED